MVRSGEKLSEESIVLMKKSKQEKLLSKYDWNLIEPYLDIDIDNGSTGKSKTHITFRKFKELIESGMSLKDMKNEGISKHLAAFMSSFAQGRIRLTKEIFEQMYLLGIELEDIARIKEIPRGDLTYLRQLYGINRKGQKFIHRKKTEIPITHRQREIIIGSLMGDGKKVSSSAVGFGQGEPQKEYLLWKFEEMKSVASEDSLKEYKYIDKRYDREGSSWRFYTHANTDIEEIIALFYAGDCKEVSQAILDQMTALSVAVWYMDDGRCNYFYVKTNGYTQPYYEFCTDSFSRESCELICE